MKRVVLTLLTLLLFCGLAIAGGGLDGFLGNLNIQAQADLGGFSAKVAPCAACTARCTSPTIRSTTRSSISHPATSASVPWIPALGASERLFRPAAIAVVDPGGDVGEAQLLEALLRFVQERAVTLDGVNAAA